MEDSTKLLSTQEISQHNSPQDCWLVIEDNVWDCTDFVHEHPGGAALILKFAGRDATKAYSEIHTPSTVQNNLPAECNKGSLDRTTVTSEWGQEPAPSNLIQAVPEKPPLHTVINLSVHRSPIIDSARLLTLQKQRLRRYKPENKFR